jgi:hypothetical protein
MIFSSRPIVGLLVFTVSAVALSAAACGNSDESKFDQTDASGTPTDASFGGDSGGQADLYKNDPPPKWCGPAGGPGAPPAPTGTDDCPSDKNKPGCGCTTEGETAPCWEGFRRNRNLGVCKDGTTKCIRLSETRLGWDKCEGQVLPEVGAKGKAACSCFSEGVWKIPNISPCFWDFSDGTSAAVSTVVDGTGKSSCPPFPGNPPAVAPPEQWSTDTLQVDCAGKFKLCFELKAGKYEAPLPTDCSLTKVCVEGDYVKEDVEQAFPPLPSWASNDSACVKQWNAVGGYGEMTVQGLSVLCDNVDDGSGGAFVFNRVKYCPAKCRNGQNPNDPECQNCGQGGAGTF